MKYMLILTFSILTLTSGLSPQSADAEEAKKASTYQVVKSESSFFGSLWTRIKRIIPRNSATTNATATAVLGVRGAETTESALMPHWEGDMTNDANFQNDIKQFEDGTKLCESEAPSQGEGAFESLLKTSNNDMLKANTLIALASCYAQHGDESKGREHLQTFLEKYPQHPMHSEVKTWLASNK